MNRIKSRIKKLEAGNAAGFRPFQRIVVKVGQSIEDAKAEYEAKHGPLGDSPNLIVRVTVAPMKRAA